MSGLCLLNSVILVIIWHFRMCPSPGRFLVRNFHVLYVIIVHFLNVYAALAPLSIGFAAFMVHLATIPVTRTGINPARSFGAAVIYGHKKSWDDHWIFRIGPLIRATVAAAFHKYVIRASLKWHSKDPNHV